MKKFSSPAQMFSENLKKFLKRAGIVVVSVSLGAATFITISSDQATVYSDAKMLSVAEVEPTAVEDTKVEYSKVEYNDLQTALAEAEQKDRIERAEKRAAAVALARAAEEAEAAEAAAEAAATAEAVARAEAAAKTAAETPTEASTTAPTTAEVVEVVYVDNASSESGTYLGTYTATAYCGCSSCCGKSDGITASGTKATQGRTVAAPSSFSFGTELVIDGHTYVVEDRGGSISGNRLDIYFDSHQEALNYGRRTVEVYSN